MMTKPEYSSALGNALDVRGDVWHWQVLRLLATITHSWCYVTFGAKGGAKQHARGACEVPAGVVLFEGDKWHITYQVYEQKKRLPQTSIEKLKGIKNKN